MTQGKNMNELELIVACISDKNKILRLLEEDENLFIDIKARTVFRCLKSLTDLNSEIDLHNIRAYLCDIGKTILANELMGLYATAPAIIDLDTSIKFLYKKRNKQNLTELSIDVMDLIKQNKNQDEIIDHISKKIETLNHVKSDDFISVQEMANKNLDDIFSKEIFVKSGIPELDDIIFALFNTQLIILAARPGQGKSSLALDIIENVPGKSLLFSLEMPRKQLYARLLSKYAEVEAWKIKIKKMNDEEFKKVAIAHNDLKSKLNIIFIDKAHDFNKMTRMIKKFCEKEKIKCIVIDYLQLIAGVKGENRNLVVSHMTRTLKNLAVEHELPIILLSQFSRDVEKQNREPILSDLRDSGSIEQDADVVLFLHDGKIIVAKNRDGKIGSNTIFFNKQFTTFKKSYRPNQPDYFND